MASEKSKGLRSIEKKGVAIDKNNNLILKVGVDLYFDKKCSRPKSVPKKFMTPFKNPLNQKPPKPLVITQHLLIYSISRIRPLNLPLSKITKNSTLTQYTPAVVF